jgi:hypothetical protein
MSPPGRPGGLEALRVQTAELVQCVETDQILADQGVGDRPVPAGETGQQIVTPGQTISARFRRFLRAVVRLRGEVADPLGQIAGDGTRHDDRAPAAATGAESRPLVAEGGVGHRPALVEPSDELASGYARVGQERLVEHGVPGHLA